MTTPLDTSTKAVEPFASRLESMEEGREFGFIREEAARALRALAKERDAWRERESETQESLQKIGEEFGVLGGEPRTDGVRRVLTELRIERDALRKERDEARADYEQSVDSMQTITERCKFAIEAADAKRDAALAQVAELREELNEARKHEALSIRREKTARKFWIRDAKESLAGKPAALRNRVELCELPPVRGETCPVDGMPLLVFEEAKREEDDLVAALAKVAELRTALEFYANPEIYKPHPHGPAFDRRDVSYRARAALASTEEKK